jgi:xanthine dehydrogenase accessory factor
MFDIMDMVDRWLAEGRKVALATVVETWGSAPRQAGAKMAVTEDMAMIGSVSGGCVEGAVVEEAVDCLRGGRPRLLNYGVSDDSAWEVGLACGGKISVFVEPLDRQWWDCVTQALRQNRDAATVTLMSGDLAGQKMLVDSRNGVIYHSERLDSRDDFVRAGQASIHVQRTERLKAGDSDLLADVHRPRPRLILIGGAHVAMALNDLAKTLGFRVILIDPRKAFATQERFPDVDRIYHSYPDKALQELQLDSQCYIAILTHDPKIDDPALRVALPSAAPYVGILSSKRTHEKRIERLTKAGIDAQLLERVRTPIGIEIGASTPEEIALCIMAEIVAVRNGVRV